MARKSWREPRNLEKALLDGQLTRRRGGRSIEQFVAGLNAYVPGWKSYFQLRGTMMVTVAPIPIA